jgi:hypothetical protein
MNNNKLIDTMRLFSLKNVIAKPTRVTNHSRTLLDPIIVSDTINYVNSAVFKLPDNINDHAKSFHLYHFQVCVSCKCRCLPLSK